MQIKSFVYLASTFIVTFGATTQDVLNDISTLESRLTTLNNNINNFSGGIVGGLGVHRAATDVQSAADRTTADIKDVPTPVSDTDAQSVLSAINGIVGLIGSSLSDLVAKKAAFQALPAGGIKLAKNDLNNLATSASGLEDALIAAAPADLLSQANAIKDQIDSAFTSATAAFA